MASALSELSYSSCAMGDSFVYQSLPERLRVLAADDPDREAFVFYNYDKERTVMTRKQVLEQTTHLAERLMHLGLKKGTHVAFSMKNSLEMLISNMAVVMAGGIPFFLSSNLKDGSDMVHTIRHMEGEFLFIDATEGDNNWEILEKIWPGNKISSDEIVSLKRIIFNGKTVISCNCRVSFATLSNMAVPDSIKFPPVFPEDILVYFCTSGSTGQPKEVTITHYSLFNWTKQANKAFSITDKTRFFNERSFSWIFGYPRTYLTEGATRICMDPRITVSGRHVNFLCDVIEKERCDVIFLPGYLTVDLKSRLELKNQFRYVITQIWGGERLSKLNIAGLKGTFSRKICSFYGTTEAGGVSLFTSDNIEDYEDGIIGKLLKVKTLKKSEQEFPKKSHLNVAFGCDESTGKPINGVEMKIIDLCGNTVAVGQQGEICCRVTWRFDGYRKMPKLFSEVVDNRGWFHTNNYGHMRPDGNFAVDGRMKEVISSGAYDFFPWDIENILKKIPGVAHVIAVGVPDERVGQVVCAFVVPKEGHVISDAEVQKYCDELFIGETAVKGKSSKPRYTLVFDTLPLTSTGKTDRRAIANLAKRRLDLN